MTADIAATDWCNQCYRERPLTDFISGDGARILTRCGECRARYDGWERLSVEERAARMRAMPREGTGYIVKLVARSGNRKTGRIPVSLTDPVSCPETCRFRDQGCYASFGKLGSHWRDVARTGTSWRAFCEAIALLPEGELWRHNEAGDLPGAGDELDVVALAMLVRANRGRRGFTFTAKPLRTRAERDAIHAANDAGFTINLSADSLARADELAELAIAPVTVVVPTDEDLDDVHTPAGRSVVPCLYESRGLTCAECRLCARQQRASVVAFRAHGQARAIVSDTLVRLRRKEASP